MEEKILINENMSNRDMVKAKVATETCEKHKGEILKCTGAMVCEREEKDEKTGEVLLRTVSAIKVNNGKKEFIITSISPTVASSLQTIITQCGEDIRTDGLEIVIGIGTTKAGREFLYLDLH